MSFIIETDHCVAILRGKLDISRYVAPQTPLYVTAITVSELVYGAYKSDRPADNLAQVNLLLAGVTVLPFDTGAAQRCGELKDILRRAGIPLAEPDLQIASIALRHALPLATHNQGHFARVPGLKLVDWL
ncbi:MAG: type II toxin-antitoxin system VapC family toxin [Chloroflexi bacterium]|nr:type II toxin-antitoxin system VapC family toxin [Chloroflexota bacterium]